MPSAASVGEALSTAAANASSGGYPAISTPPVGEPLFAAAAKPAIDADPAALVPVAGEGLLHAPIAAVSGGDAVAPPVPAHEALPIAPAVAGGNGFAAAPVAAASEAVPDPLGVTPRDTPALEAVSPVAVVSTPLLSVLPEPSWPVDDHLVHRQDTVVLDMEMQDRLMALRARQDLLLKSRFGAEVVVMFSDQVGSTAYYEQYGDLRGRQKMLVHNALLFPIIRAHNGTIIKTIGDAIMACFTASEACLAAAREMQQTLREHNRGNAEPDEEIHIRIGINAGSAIAEDGDLHGDAVNVAARVQATAGGGDILVTESVIAANSSHTFESIGLIQFRGKAEPIQIFRLKWGGEEEAVAKGPRVILTRYRLKDEIGRGPLGVVYAAEDMRLKMPVVPKLFYHFQVDNAAAEARLTQWMQTQASLIHAGIVRVIDCSAPGIDDPFMVADRVDGPDLSLWITRNGCPDFRRSCRLVRDIAEAISYAHRRAVVHGNLKPENVLIDPYNRPLLSDFGGAFLANAAQPDNPIASVAFLAPEQVTGARADPRSDVYGLGALLYFLFTGRPPFKTTASLHDARAVASGLFKPLDRLRPDLPRDLLEVCGRAMAAQADNRYSTVDELAEALRNFCDYLPPNPNDAPGDDAGPDAATEARATEAEPEPDVAVEETYIGLRPRPGPGDGVPSSGDDDEVIPVALHVERVDTLKWALLAACVVAAGALITLAVVLAR